MRVGANSQKMTRDEIINCFKKEGRIHFEKLINEKADFEKDFDPQAFKHFLKLSGISQAIAQEALLKNLDCLTDNKKLTNLGVLFFTKDIDFIMNYALVDCILFKGTDKVKILDRKQYKGNIIQNIENALAFVQRHTNTEYVITGRPRREEISDYPEVALREAIVNAVCHRDYFEKRSHVVVEVFSNRVEIYNPPGELPSGLDKKTFGTKSVPRNFLIASMLHRANYIEKAGTGINRIKQAIKDHKKKVTLDIKYGDGSMFYSVIFKKIISMPNKCVIWGTPLVGKSDISFDPSQAIKNLINQRPFISHQPPVNYTIYNPYAGGLYTLSHKLLVTLPHDFKNSNDKEKIRLSGHIAQENLKNRIPSLDKIMKNQKNSHWLNLLPGIPNDEKKAFLLLKGLVSLYPEGGSGIPLDLSLNQVNMIQNDPTPFLRALSYSTSQDNFKYLLYEILGKYNEYIEIDSYMGGRLDIQITLKGFKKVRFDKENYF